MKIQIVEPADGSEHELNGAYVVSYDPDYHWPSGHYDGGWLVVTEEASDAKEFTNEEALRLILSSPVCACHHYRPDGELNRPLTAFTLCLG